METDYRTFLELLLVEYLISSLNDFWEPVKVVLSESELNTFKIINSHDECTICYESCLKFNEMTCCKNKICTNCTKDWFNRSVYCPYCKQDLRDYLKK